MKKKLLTLGMAVMMAASMTACASKTTTDSTLKFGQIQYAANGTRGFAVTTVVMQGDKIAKAYIDEYQAMPKADAECVPNSDAEFGDNFADTTQSLASKRVNAEYYSGLMKEYAGATVAIDANYDAIQAYCEGKTIAELEKAIEGKDAAAVTDAVSGATLADTSNYIKSIIEAAKAAK